MPSADAKQIRWGILGPGAIARKFANGVRQSKTGVIAAAASRSPERARAFCDDIEGARAFDTYADLVGSGEVDAVYIATIHPSHAELCRLAIEARVPVLCEKPLTMTTTDTEDVAELAATARVFCMEGFMYRCHPLWRRAIELVRGGAVGTPRAIEASFGFVRPDTANPRLTDPDLGGSAILDIGCYPLTAARAVAAAAGYGRPEPDELIARGTRHPQTGVDDHTCALMTWRPHTANDPDGTLTASIACSIDTWLPNRVTVAGDAGVIDVPHPWHGTGHEGGRSVITVRERTKTGAERTIEEPVETREWLFGIEADHVAACLSEGLTESPIVTLDDSIATARTLDRWLDAVPPRP